MCHIDSKFIILLVLIGCYTSMGGAQSDNMYQRYVAHKASEPIQIDGVADEEVWKHSAWSEDFIDIEGDKKPLFRTQVKMLWDDTYFYILANIEEPHVWADIEKRDAIIFYNNDFEVFIDPDGDTHNYYELELNALNTAWDLFITKPYRESAPIINGWDITGLKSAVTVNGTLNNPSDIDKGWVLELAIPWEAYKVEYHKKNVPTDKFWRVNFSRVNWEHSIADGKYSRKKDVKGKYLPEYNWVWSPQGVINMHEPEKWGYVFFSSKPVGANVDFVIPNDEKIKWKLFEIYRNQRAYRAKHKTWATALDLVKGDEFKIEGKSIVPIIENHSLGYNIFVKSPFSGKQLIIREDGKFSAR